MSAALIRNVHALVHVVILFGAAAACVPAGDDPKPAGAAGVIAEPSAATRGEPFTTSDGYLIRITSITLFANTIAGPDGVQFGDGGLFIWNGAERRELLVRGLPVGPKVVTTRLFAPPPPPRSAGGPNDEPAGGKGGIQANFMENLGVPATTEARFRQPADGWEESGKRPALLLAGRAEKDGRVVTFDLAMVMLPSKNGGDGSESEEAAAVGDEVVTQRVDVVANAPALARIEVAVEKLFPAFQEIDDADRMGDGDGRVTGIELRNKKIEPESELTLLERLAERARGILIAR